MHTIANYLAPRLEQQVLVGVRMADPIASRKCTEKRVEAVEARGKHLFITLENGTALRSHLGMHGSWHRYAHDEEWQKPRRQASLIISTQSDDYVCFNAKEVELVSLSSVRNRIVHGRLGPDLIADEVDVAGLVRRAREFLEGDALLADVLLDQRVAAGIGNVYKSEVLFIERLHPNLALDDVADDMLARCFATAADRLRRNTRGGKRVTRLENDGAGRLWVYGRRGKPCLECDTPIRSSRLGKHHRSTYWCPDCQRIDDRRGPGRKS